MYKIKELFYTLQGEGAQAGRPAVFCRFTGCNLWTGREEDREKAICKFCDTDFIGTDGENGGKYTAEELASKAASLWSAGLQEGKPYIVCTGGEPLLQLNVPLLQAFHNIGFEVAIETNGTIPVPEGVDWVCMSPKAYTEIVVKSGNELKLVFPQSGIEPTDFVGYNFEHFFIQPMDSPLQAIHTRLAIDYCLSHPKWRLSLQTHKLINIP